MGSYNNLYGVRENAAALAFGFALNRNMDEFSTIFEGTSYNSPIQGYEGFAGLIGLIVGLSEAMDKYESGYRERAGDDAEGDIYGWGGVDWYEAMDMIINEFITRAVNTANLPKPEDLVFEIMGDLEQEARELMELDDE